MSVRIRDTSSQFVSAVSVDNDIVHENYYFLFSYHSGERFIHIPLESGGCISLSEKHNEGFENSSWSDKRRLPLVSSLNSDVGEPPSHVKLGEVR